MGLIIDASVALKWVLNEEGTSEARALLSADAEPMASPGLLWVEVANVLWVKTRRGQLDKGTASAALAAIHATPIRSIPTRDLIADALGIALDLQQTAYDCLYLAAALAERCVLVSADQAFVAAAQGDPRYRAFVRLLTPP
jgi:predicted nucleic acid-binding protein